MPVVFLGCSLDTPSVSEDPDVLVSRVEATPNLIFVGQPVMFKVFVSDSLRPGIEYHWFLPGIDTVTTSRQIELKIFSVGTHRSVVNADDPETSNLPARKSFPITIRQNSRSH